MTTIEKELDYLYQHKDNQNQTLLKKRVINVLLKGFCDCISIDKKATDNELVKTIMSLNDILNKHPLCANKLIPKDDFLYYSINQMDLLECEELKQQLMTEKARRNLLEANDNYGWAEDCEVSEEEFIK